MKKLLVGICVIISLKVAAQKSIATTDNFTVEGAVKKTQTFTLQNLSGLRQVAIDSVVITNHLLERKGTIKKIKGILLKDVLARITIDQENSKLLSEYYLVCEAADNYKVVFSWNEIFNSETGNHVFIITEQDGKKAEVMENHIALISPNDLATGRRYVKGLKKITIERVR